MIQFNLLPDLKLQYIRANRFKHTAMIVSFIVAASSLAIFIFLFMTVYVFQKEHIKNVTNDIASSQKQLDDTKDLNKVLTIQNQLNTLTQLHDSKPVNSRLFTFLYDITPSNITIGAVSMTHADHKMTLSGTTDTLSSINTFVDTIKFVTYKDLNIKDTDTHNPFTGVVLGTYSVDDKGATFDISFDFDPLIFDNSKNIKLSVPNIISTRSETEKPADLFKAIPKKDTKAQ